MLLFVWLALSPCLRKWGKAESFVGSWQFQCGRWASSPRDMVSRWGDGLSPVLGCFPLVWSGSVWSPLFQRRRSGRKPCSWRFSPLFLGHMMMFYFCLDLAIWCSTSAYILCARKIRVLFDFVVLVALFGWIIVSESWQLSWFWFDYCSCSVLVMLWFQELFRKALFF